MISYCIACYRPVYCRLLIHELIRKTTARYEILLWLNLRDEGFEKFLHDCAVTGAPLRIVGRTPENIGMAAYPALFSEASFDLVTQIDDDVVCVSSRIAEIARETFERFPQIGMLTADVWQDEYTTGARPPMDSYREINGQFGLYQGPIDGFFAVYRRTSLALCRGIRPACYFPLGSAIKRCLQSVGHSGLLCTRMRVFHAIGPAYASCFDMLDAEIAKYGALGRQEIVDWYRRDSTSLPPRSELTQRVENIRETLADHL